jgi:hypothetical protein
MVKCVPRSMATLTTASNGADEVRLRGDLL